MTLFHPLLYPFYCLLLGGVLVLILPRGISSKGRGWLALLAGAGALIGVLAVYPAVAGGGALELKLTPWDGPFALSYHADGLSLLFALMAVAIGSAVLLYSIDYMDHDPGTPRFYALMLLFIAGLVHLVYSADLLLMYLSWEVIGLCSFLLVGFWYQKKEAVDGARKVIAMTHLAGYGLLAGILILFARTGSTLWTDPAMKGALTGGVFLLFLFAAGAKSVQFPLHTWIPDAMAAPTPVSALLHAACYVKAGVYLIARLYSITPWPAAWGTLLIWIGTITMLVGVLFAMIQTDVKRMLAYHTVSQIGYMMLGLGLGTPLGITAGLLHCLNHGFFKGGLFLGAGAVQHATGSKDMNELGGLGKKMPRTALFWIVNAAAISGIPLFSGFVSKWLLYNAALEMGQLIPAFIAWLVSILTVFSFMKATSAVYLGNETPLTAEKGAEAPATMRWGMGLLAGGSLLFGIAPQIPIHYLIHPVLGALGFSAVTRVTWFGLDTGGGNWWSTAGLLMAILAGLAGLLCYALARASKQIPAGSFTAPGNAVFTGGEPLSAAGRMTASDFSAIIHHGLAPFYRGFDVDRYYREIWKELRRIGDGAETLSRRVEKQGLILLPAILIVLVVIGFSALPATGALAGEAHFPAIWALGLGLASLALIAAAWISKPARRHLPALILCAVLVGAGVLLADELLRLVFLEAATFVLAWVVWKASADRKTAVIYLSAVALSAACLFGAHFLLAAGQTQLGAALYFAGFALKLALIPAYLWLSAAAAAVPALVVAWITSVVDMAAFAELWQLRQVEPGIFAPPGPWLALAVLSALGGALLMLGQRDIKRFLAFSSIEDMGYLIAGVSLGGQWGLEGALFGALTHILAKTLLFSSLVLPENSGPLTLDRRGQAQSFPFSAFGFLIGTLAMLGIPPLAGFNGRWRLYLTVYEANPYLLGAFLLATGLALLAYIRVLTGFWWYDTGEPAARAAEPKLLTGALAALTLLLLAAGVVPGLVPLLKSLVGG